MIGTINHLVTRPWFQRFADQRSVARWFGYLADTNRLPQWLLARIIRAYCRSFGIRTEDFDLGPGPIANFNAFFTRPLKPGARPLAEGIVAPADGYLCARGRLDHGLMMQVKGRHYALDDLLGETVGWQDGHYATIYLSPADYHRFHAPCDMRVSRIHRLPGDLLTTNREAIATCDRVYCRNERLVLRADSAQGPFYLIAVGATLIGRARIMLDPRLGALLTDHREASGPSQTFVPPVTVAKGAELGCFEMGSTVILVFASPDLTTIRPDDPESPRIRVGETLWRP
ncbi:archaetidylserine decarboxylase [Niveispirillum sp.]|uniref:archaetidylserine decarboxylase n=1 Tax=Niveispirillum sp. TaxID=1917217 RepID=UPI001B4D055F|nr:archaetidylserine decarboxylase [Niveispirillum sp.]MBP7337654.1 phosphatidylserine decarboxylase [Niveispirillum sp.]